MAATMLSVTAPYYTPPSNYQHSTLPRPVVSDPSDVVVQVRAASVNPIDVKKAAGMLKMLMNDEFPYPIGFDCAGVVSEVGSRVETVKVGDEVYARVPEASRGSWSEFVKCSDHYVTLKPTSLSFSDAASLPLAAVTGLQALRKYKGSLSGKTVFIPAGLSGTGAYALQLAKRVFNAGKVITTVSTSKVNRVPELLGQGVVDQIIDYTKEDPSKAISSGSVDFILDTTGQAMQFLSLMAPSNGHIVSIATTPGGTQIQESSLMRRPDHPKAPWAIRTFLDLSDSIRRYRARRYGVGYEYMILDPNAKDLDTIAGFVEERKLLPVVGSRADFHDIKEVIGICTQVYDGKGGIGKAVIEVS